MNNIFGIFRKYIIIKKYNLILKNFRNIYLYVGLVIDEWFFLVKIYKISKCIFCILQKSYVFLLFKLNKVQNQQ